MMNLCVRSSILLRSTRAWQCFPPHLQAIDCYTTSDKQLGSFLMENCFDPALRCVNEKCKESV